MSHTASHSRYNVYLCADNKDVDVTLLSVLISVIHISCDSAYLHVCESSSLPKENMKCGCFGNRVLLRMSGC
jgi:hypothetical protein